MQLCADVVLWLAVSGWGRVPLRASAAGPAHRTTLICFGPMHAGEDAPFGAKVSSGNESANLPSSGCVHHTILYGETGTVRTLRF